MSAAQCANLTTARAGLCITACGRCGCGRVCVSRRVMNRGNKVVGATVYKYNSKAKNPSGLPVFPPRQRCIEVTDGFLAFKAV